MRLARHAATWWLALVSATAADLSHGRASAAESPSGAAVPDSPLTFPPASAASRKQEEPQEVEVITLEGEPEPDRQRYAVGAEAGIGWFATRGSGRGEPGLDFGILGAFGLGTNGARVPFTLETFVS